MIGRSKPEAVTELLASNLGLGSVSEDVLQVRTVLKRLIFDRVQLVSLEMLDVSFNQLRQLNHVAKLTKLKEIRAFGNLFERLPSLEGCV